MNETMLENEKKIKTEITLEGIGIADDVLSAVRWRDWSALRSLSLRPGGFGDDRKYAWPFLLHAREDTVKSETDTGNLSPMRRRRRKRSNSSARKETADEGEDSLLSASVDSHPDERQIKLDTDRSFVLYGDEGNVEVLQAQLNDLITSVFRRHPQLSYFQGYHDIISVLYLTLSEEDRLVCAEKLSLHRLRDAMGKGLEPLLGLLHISKYLLRLVDADYAALLERNTPLPYFALSNLLTLFSHDVPTLPLIQHVFDFLLSRPPITVVYLAASITLAYKDEAFRMCREDEEGMLHSLLSTPPELSDGVESSKPGPEEHIANDILQDDLSNPFFAKGVIGEAMQLTEGVGEIYSEVFKPIDTVLIRTGLANDEQTIAGTIDDQIDLAAVAYPGSVLDKVHGMEGSETFVDLGTNSELSSQIDESQSTALPGSSIVSDLSSADLRSSGSSTTETSSRPVSPQRHESSDHARRKIVSLPALLEQADALFELYPPSNPALHVSEIVGPQSVIFTWSEDPQSFMSDEDAEAVMAHPELVVLPFVDPDEIVATREEEERAVDVDHARRRKLRKKQHFGVRFDKKTVLTGTVIALSVAVAVYSVRAKGNHGVGGSGNGGGGGGGIFGISRIDKTLRKTGKALSDFLIGDSERVLEIFNNFI